VRFDQYTDETAAPPPAASLPESGTAGDLRSRLPAPLPEGRRLDTSSSPPPHVERIAIADGGREVSHLAVRFDPPRFDPSAGADAPCFLYLHGFGSHQDGEKAEFFRARALDAGFGFCSFDFQGHGRSGGSLVDLTLTRNLADIRSVQAWLAERGVSRLVLVGSSMGGGTALWHAAREPESVVAGLHIAPALELDRALLSWAGPERVRAWRETGRIRYESELVSCDLSWGLIEDLRAHPAEELALRLRTPTLLLQGRRDATVSWRNVADFAARCRAEAVELHLFADGDHRLTDRKERLWGLMLEFLRGRGLL
jgi:pimeloyl-ACP methyl ester carboxylesterase